MNCPFTFGRMNRFLWANTSMKTSRILLGIAGISFVLCGCNDKPTTADRSASGPALASDEAVTPVRATSFEAVTRRLDAGGNVFAYLATDQWLAGLSTNIASFRELVLGLPDIKEADRANLEKVSALLIKGVERSGLEQLTGIGLSGIQVTPELHRVKLIYHHEAGQGDGLMWNLFGTQPHALTGLDLLSTNTALAAFGDLNALLLWHALASGLGEAGIPELSAALQRWPAEFEQRTQLSWTELLESLGGEVGLVLYLNESRRVSLPIGPEGVGIPEPGLMLALKVNNDLLFERLTRQLRENPATEFSEEAGLKICAMPIPLPIPMELKITVATTGDYLFVASSPKLVQDAVAIRAGQLPGARQLPEVQAMLKFLPTQGNQFSYVSRKFSETLIGVQKKMITSTGPGMTPEQMKLLDKLMTLSGTNYGLGISVHTATGWETVSVGSQDSATTLVLAPVVGGTAIGAAMILPALSKAKGKAQSVACQNHMKQICLAFLIWSSDHNDKFPFHAGASDGGTLELCDRDAEGYDRNAARHFQAMAAELGTPKILVCPDDSSKSVAPRFEQLKAENVSYRLRTGPRVTDVNPGEILIYCPEHHHVGRVDGSVHPGTTKARN
jgi:hypothetical protein